MLRAFLFASRRVTQVEAVARSIRIAGELGSDGIPADLKSTETSRDGHAFTVVENSQAIRLAALQDRARTRDVDPSSVLSHAL